MSGGVKSGGVVSGGVESGKKRCMTNAEFREVLEERTTKFAIEVFKLLKDLPYDVPTKIISYQLGKSASSIGANYYEANRGESKDDFVHKASIALKEANETVYWFRVLSGLFKESCLIQPLAQEASELRNLLQKIVHSSKQRLKT